MKVKIISVMTLMIMGGSLGGWPTVSPSVCFALNSSGIVNNEVLLAGYANPPTAPGYIAPDPSAYHTPLMCAGSEEYSANANGYNYSYNVDCSGSQSTILAYNPQDGITYSGQYPCFLSNQQTAEWGCRNIHLPCNLNTLTTCITNCVQACPKAYGMLSLCFSCCTASNGIGLLATSGIQSCADSICNQCTEQGSVPASCNGFSQTSYSTALSRCIACSLNQNTNFDNDTCFLDSMSQLCGILRELPWGSQMESPSQIQQVFKTLEIIVEATFGAAMGTAGLYQIGAALWAAYGSTTVMAGTFWTTLGTYYLAYGWGTTLLGQLVLGALAGVSIDMAADGSLQFNP